MLKVEFDEIRMEDLELIRSWRNSKHVSQYMYTDDIISKESQIIWYSKIINSPSSKYWIIKYNNLKIGIVNLTDINYSNSSCSWAFYIGELEYRDSGAGVQTEYMIIEKVFNEIKLNKIYCEVISSNTQVINLHRRFGFKTIINEDHFIIKNGESIPVVKLCLIDVEWLIVKEKIKKILFNNN
jgi:UDP-4-amino-4,6-dideoxy-N-acetyl-beta-L-altrosamine N-acetyltransferase